MEMIDRAQQTSKKDLAVGIAAAIKIPTRTEKRHEWLSIVPDRWASILTATHWEVCFKERIVSDADVGTLKLRHHPRHGDNWNVELRSQDLKTEGRAHDARSLWNDASAVR